MENELLKKQDVIELFNSAVPYDAWWYTQSRWKWWNFHLIDWYICFTKVDLFFFFLFFYFFLFAMDQWILIFDAFLPNCPLFPPNYISTLFLCKERSVDDSHNDCSIGKINFERGRGIGNMNVETRPERMKNTFWKRKILTYNY